jgi:DNA-binding CsgD family transcriptional regulator
MTESPKPDSSEDPLGLPVRRDRSVAARRTARLKKAKREARIISLLNRGVSVGEIAAREGLSLKRMRNLVRDILAQRMPQPPAEFVALQISRLNEALLVSYSAMHTYVSGANFEAVDRVVRIVRELDRYHGFAAVPRPREEVETRRLPAPVESPLVLEGPIRSDSEMAPQTIEKAQYGLANSPLPRGERERVLSDQH